MVSVFSQNLKRRYLASAGSGAFLFTVLSIISVIIFAFLIAYYSGGLWVKEKDYREQPIVSFKHAHSVRIQGMRESQPFELVHSTIPDINNLAGPSVRIPEVRFEKEDHNLDQIADLMHLSLSFPIRESEGVTQVQGVFLFRYVLKNKVRVDMEAPVFVDYSGGVPGRQLTMDGRLTLKVANPLAVRPGVLGANMESLLPMNVRVSGPEVSFDSLIAKAAARNETTVLEPVRTSWDTAFQGCDPQCKFTLKLTVRIPNEKVLYVPTFIEVAKFSWIQFLSTAIFLALFVRPLMGFVFSQQVVQTIVVDDKPMEKIY